MENEYGRCKRIAVYVGGRELLKGYIDDDGFKLAVYECEVCKKDIYDTDPRIEIDGGKTYCGECAFKHNIIGEQEYIDTFCFWLQVENVRAVVHDGEVHITYGKKKFPWEQSNGRNRDSRYHEWRKKVFQRDRYTCQMCKKVGGILNAHHVKAWKAYPELRYEVSNGQTLCYECHKEYHRKNGK